MYFCIFYYLFQQVVYIFKFSFLTLNVSVFGGAVFSDLYKLSRNLIDLIIP